jgi:hypothetical protein
MRRKADALDFVRMVIDKKSEEKQHGNEQNKTNNKGAREICGYPGRGTRTGSGCIRYEQNRT